MIAVSSAHIVVRAMEAWIATAGSAGSVPLAECTVMRRVALVISHGSIIAF